MPLAAISPGDQSWRKASRYLRMGRDDLRVVRTAAPHSASTRVFYAHYLVQHLPTLLI